MIGQLKIAILMTVILTIVTGFVYPLATTFCAQVVFPHQANGSLITVNQKIIGSKLIGQKFERLGYFHPRPSYENYNGTKSGGSNLAPTNKILIQRIFLEAKKLSLENPAKQIPVDLLTASGSGLDPHISPHAAEFQIPRISRARRISENKLHELVLQYTEKRQLGFLGEPRVNILLLNLALDKFLSLASAVN